MAAITIKYVGPMTAIDVPLLRKQVARDATVEVTVKQARMLLPQAIWQAVSKAAKDVQRELDKPAPADAAKGASDQSDDANDASEEKE